MELNHVTTILLTGASVSLGAIFGSLRSRIFSSKSQTKLHYYFYAFAALLFVVSITFAIIYKKDFLQPNWFGIIVLVIALSSSIALYLLTKKYLIIEEILPVKDTFNIDELNPIVNQWTSNADTQAIKLFGGDLNFFGDGPNQMESNIQYTHLRSMGFRKILVLCEAPQTQPTRIRYGKILYDMPATELRFYKPPKADLNVRGRIIRVQNVNRLLVYEKKGNGLYRPIQTDGGNSNGALYNDIWELAWELARPATTEETEKFKELYRGV